MARACGPRCSLRRSSATGRRRAANFATEKCHVETPTAFSELLADPNCEGCGRSHLGGGDHLSRPVARGNAGLPDPDPGVPHGSRIFDPDHRQSRAGLPCITAAWGRLLAARSGVAAPASLRIEMDTEFALLVADQLSRSRVDEEARRKMVDYSNILFERLGCLIMPAWIFRADAEGEIRLLEINPNPDGAGTASSI